MTVSLRFNRCQIVLHLQRFAGRDDQFWILSTSGKSISFFGKSTIHFVIEIDPCPPL